MAMQTGVNRGPDMIQVKVLSVDGNAAVVRDQTGRTLTITRTAVRAKGSLPQAGETWFCDRSIANQWTFSLCLNATDLVANLQNQVTALQTSLTNATTTISKIRGELFGDQARSFAPHCTVVLNNDYTLPGGQNAVYIPASQWSASNDPEKMYLADGSYPAIKAPVAGVYRVWGISPMGANSGGSTASSQRMGTFIVKGPNYDDSVSLARDVRTWSPNPIYAYATSDTYLRAGDTISQALFCEPTKCSASSYTRGISTSFGMTYLRATA